MERRHQLRFDHTHFDIYLSGCCNQQSVYQCLELQCDRGLVIIVLLNLIGNALKFSRMRDHALIEIGHLVTDEGRVIFVRDNGVGFDMQYSNKLFRPFERLHNRADIDGTGAVCAHSGADHASSAHRSTARRAALQKDKSCVFMDLSKDETGKLYLSDTVDTTTESTTIGPCVPQPLRCSCGSASRQWLARRRRRTSPGSSAIIVRHDRRMRA